MAAAAPRRCRTLLVDNFDSYTFNLYQLLAQANGGAAPLVVTSDASWEAVERLLSQHAIDSVVISPGPGTPVRDGDFGVCAAVLRRCALPTLGVCLGHQGICALRGATVARAPEPMHGRLSEVTVLQPEDPLFSGIPSGFSAVRYHSLAVERGSLPPSIVPLAETADGVLMACRVADEPQWGVQFHPESICTEHGATLLANFLDIAASCRGEALPPPPLPAAVPAAVPAAPVQAAAKRTALLVDSLPFPETPEEFSAAVYGALLAEDAGSFWLDSATASGASASADRRARFSFMGGSDGAFPSSLT